MKLKHFPLTPVLVFLVLGSIAATQAVFDRAAVPFRKEVRKSIILLNDPLVPNVATMKFLSFGNPAAAADMLWIRTIQYFGASTPYGKYPTLAPLTDVITQLDPKFQYPYEFAMITLPFMGKARDAARIGERGVAQYPNDGWLNYYLATVYHLNLSDYQNAYKYYLAASMLPNAPTSAATLAGTALNHIDGSLDDRLVAAEFWKAVYERAKTDDQRETAKNWWAQMQIVYSIEYKAEQYKKATGRYPEKLEDLVSSGYLQEVPKSPVERKYLWDNEKGRIEIGDRIVSD